MWRGGESITYLLVTNWAIRGGAGGRLPKHLSQSNATCKSNPIGYARKHTRFAGTGTVVLMLLVCAHFGIVFFRSTLVSTGILTLNPQDYISSTCCFSTKYILWPNLTERRRFRCFCCGRSICTRVNTPDDYVEYQLSQQKPTCITRRKLVTLFTTFGNQHNLSDWLSLPSMPLASFAL